MHVSPSIRWQLRLNSLLTLVLFLSLVGILAWLSNRYAVTEDWTANHRYSLAPVTAQFLRANPEPFKFIAFVSDNANLHRRIRRQIGLYRAVDPKIRLRFINPGLHPASANRYGVTHSGQMAIVLGDRHQVVDSLGQAVILNALMRLTRGAEQWVVFLSGQDERSPFDTSSAGLSRFAAALEQAGLHLQTLNLLRIPQIPENTAVVVIAQPRRPFTAGETALIQRYLDAGGSLLWLHAPGSLHGLSPLARLLGIRFLPGTVVNADASLQNLLGMNSPAVVPVLNYGPSPITQTLKIQTLFPFSAAIAQPAGNRCWKATPLLRTLPQSFSANAPLKGEIRFDPKRGDTLGPLIIGEALAHTGVNAGKQARAVVIGSGAFLSNAFIGQGANLDLAIASLNWLAHDDSLIQIHLPSAPDTRLQLTRLQAYALAIFFLLGLPSILLLGGGLIWWRRRRPAR